ncbi:MAG: hypothetical protein H6728_04655 [Myxococcales bacterium]|nr:hypothetical protein [Myxococcales bacterium]MCB9642344.1 hypothetical protein [Myxococcales bacterium]
MFRRFCKVISCWGLRVCWCCVLTILVWGGGAGRALAQSSRPSSRQIKPSVKRPTSRPSSQVVVRAPASRPTSLLALSKPAVVRVLSPSSKPTSLSTTRRVARPTSLPSTIHVVRRVPPTRKAPQTQPKHPSKLPIPSGSLHRVTLVPQRVPDEISVFSFALPSRYVGWIDGLYVGRFPVTYLRIAAGPHTIEVAERAKPNEKPKLLKRIPVIIPAGQHLVMGERRGKFGFRFQRDEEHRVFLRSYRKGQRPEQRVLSPGPFCPPKGKCLFVAPGETLYLTEGKLSLVQPPVAAEKAVRPFNRGKTDGFLTLYSFPPGILLLNGRVYAMTPVAKLPVSPGRYNALVINGYVKQRWTQEITIRSGAHTRKVAFLAPMGGGALRLLSSKPARVFVHGLYRGWTPYFVGLPSGKHEISLYWTQTPPIHRSVLIQPGSVKTFAY